MQVSARTQTRRLPEPLQTPDYRERTQARRLAPKKQWVIAPPNPRAAHLAKSLKVSPLLAQVLINRGVTDVDAGSAFLRPKLTKLISPELMPGVKPAVERIKQAIKNKEKITIYGDYDVDGITGVAILWQLLTLLNARVDYYIPHRVDEGYGLNEDAVRLLAQAHTKLLVTVDCGITAFNSAELARKLGIELMITDHHQPGPKLPPAHVIVHPALEQSYPNQDSSGSMVAFKLAWAVANEFKTGKKLQPRLREFMLSATSLAAMGTIADIVDLRGENRTLTSYGLRSIPHCELCGVQALIESAGLTGQGLDSFSIGFRIAPMLNAAGRLGHARLAVELLTTQSAEYSTQIAEYLKDQNERRRRLERKIFKQACEMIVRQNLHHPHQKTIVLASSDWHTGVIGIVASRIVDKYYRPTILINTAPSENGFAQGSARSVDGFCLLTAVTACSQHLIDFGGHKAAAGITIEPEKINDFAQRFENYAKQHLNSDDAVNKLNIDALTSLGQFTKDAVDELQMLAPFGPGNPKPVFAAKGVRLASHPRKVGTKADHLQLAVADNTNTLRCIGFGMGRLDKKLLEREFFDVAFYPQINNFNNAANVELVLADVRFE
ncbi:MAG: single-stranded-DNA-specific exonuclease RecJ [Planctomycetota bacterium]|nr:MAG: single-stranded-DNA-specific exonuclease RecJ [Planctomycetota bacterium]